MSARIDSTPLREVTTALEPALYEAIEEQPAAADFQVKHIAQQFAAHAKGDPRGLAAGLTFAAAVVSVAGTLLAEMARDARMRSAVSAEVATDA